jgi:hypothetical protein
MYKEKKDDKSICDQKISGNFKSGLPSKLKMNLHSLTAATDTLGSNQFSFLTSQRAYFKSRKSNKALDLFSGSGVVGQQLRKYGFEIFSLDISPSAKPTFCTDILQWDYTQFPPHFFRIIAAGVPCNEYSAAKTVGERNLAYADKVVLKTLEIIKYFEPEIWWIENPRGGKLKDRDFMKNLHFVDIDYCQFSDWGYQKPTRIWCCWEMAKLAPRVCDHKSCPNLVQASGGGVRQRERLGGREMKFGTKQKWRIPSNLVDYLMSPFHLNDQQSGWSRVGPRGKLTPEGAPTQGQHSALILPERLLKPRGTYPINRVQTIKGDL